MIEAVAVSKYVRGSPKKLKKITDLIKGKGAEEALTTLLFLSKPSKEGVLKTLKAAIANALVKGGKAKITDKDLFVKEARVDKGAYMKRYRPASRGRIVIIKRPTSHITVKVAQRGE